MSNKTTLAAEPGSPIITIERIFDAPREKVFSIFSEKDFVAQWWSPRHAARVDELDFREGGMWKFSSSSEAGEITFHGYFHEITAPERFVQTSEFDNLLEMIGERGHTVLAKYAFNALADGRTQLITTEIYMSAQDRDMAIQNDMESGVIACYNAIDTILVGLK